MTQKRALVLSIDAMTDLDLEVAREYPHFSEILSHCAFATNVESVFPSLTYPCHVAMATGCAPMHTGIYNNEAFLPDTFRRPWYFYASQIARPTIFAFAAKAGISTGCVMWPCMGKGPIDTLVPEIWGETPDAPFLEPFCSAGSEAFIREIWPTVGEIAHGFHQPEFDTFVCRIAEEVIRRRRPELLYVHMCQIDNAKHYRGLNSPERIRAIENTDALLGRLLAALEQEGLCDLAMRGFEAVSAYEDSRERAELLSETVKKSQDFTRALCLAEVGQQEQANEMLRSLEDFQNASLHIWPVANFSAKQLRDDKTSPKSDVFTAPDGTKHRYQIFKGVRTWKEAKVFCEVLGGHLATPTTDEENQFVYRFMRDSGYLTAYFGLSDEKRVGDWIWVTGEPFEYTNWHRGEPQRPRAVRHVLL